MSAAGILFFSCPSFLDKPREETLATQAKSSGEELSFVISEGDVRKVNYRWRVKRCISLDGRNG